MIFKLYKKKCYKSVYPEWVLMDRFEAKGWEDGYEYPFKVHGFRLGEDFRLEEEKEEKVV